MTPTIRRLLVIVGVIATLSFGVATIRAAASWTAGSAPLATVPPSMESLAAQLSAEGMRTADLRRELDAVRRNTVDLAGALDAARVRIKADLHAADQLRSRLSRAKTRLAALEAALARARPSTSRTLPRSGRRASLRTTGEQSDGEADG